MEWFDMDFVQSCMSESITGIIHVGAHHAQETQDYVPLGVPVLWFEAHPDYAKWMFRRIDHLDNHHGFVVLLADKDDQEVDFWLTADEYASSILRPKEHQRYHPQAQLTGSVKFNTSRYDTYFDQHLKERFDPADFNLLTLDVQGSEKLVWDGMGKHRKHFKAVISEYSTVEYYTDCPRIEDLDSAFGEYGLTRVYPTIGHEAIHGDGLWVI